MTPAMRLLRMFLLLPISEAADREQKLQKATADLGRARETVSDAKSRLQERARDLREAYDDLLGKLE